MPCFTRAAARALRRELPPDGLQQRFGKPGVPQRPEDVIRLSGNVTVDVLGKLRSERLLQSAVLGSGRGTATQEVSKRQVVRQRLAALNADVKMMGRQSRRRGECLPAFDAEISLVRVPQGAEPRNRFRHADLGGHDDIHVDDRLGGEPGNRRATDVLH